MKRVHQCNVHKGLIGNSILKTRYLHNGKNTSKKYAKNDQEVGQKHG